MDSAKVSVVIPLYNMEAFLAETLDSVLASDYPNFEVIVMDDGSTDRSLDIARSYAERDARVKAFTQTNTGACAARNAAIAHSSGTYILPVDADNRIAPTFIRHAVEAIEADEEVKVVCPRAEFFGDRTGEWKLRPYSPELLARKNMMDTCALYRRADWERVGGYCEEIIAREDWEFWIAVLKDGGRVVRLPDVELYYRIREGSKRVTDRQLKRHVVDVLNRRHPDFFFRYLRGPLHYHRSWSRLLNTLHRLLHPQRVVVNPQFRHLAAFVVSLPERFANEGEIIYKGRNELRSYECGDEHLVVKSYRIPHLINRLVYGTFRASKAERSYRYALRLEALGIGTPQPVGFHTVSCGLLFGRSYSVSLKSACPYTYRDFAHHTFERRDDILRAIARTTAKLHDAGILHKDYSAGNILFRDDLPDIPIEIIDLNRMRFHPVSMEEGCKNFERLPGDEAMYRVMADEYARLRGFDADACLRLMLEARAKEAVREKAVLAKFAAREKKASSS